MLGTDSPAAHSQLAKNGPLWNQLELLGQRGDARALGRLAGSGPFCIGRPYTVAMLV
jgi:hypothetical protein